MYVVHNITFHVNENIAEAWIEALSRDYIPLVKRAVSCSRALFTRVRVAGESDTTFSLQLFFDQREERRDRVEERLDESLSVLSRRFPGGFLYFRSVLEEVIHEA